VLWNIFWCSSQIVLNQSDGSLWSKMTIQNDEATRVSFGTLGQGPRQVKSLQEKLDEKVRLEHQLKETGPWRPWRLWESGKHGLSVKGNPWKLTTRDGPVDVGRFNIILINHPFWLVEPIFTHSNITVRIPILDGVSCLYLFESWQFAVLISIHSTSFAKNILRPNYAQ
jgi:hypothetical protein